MSSEILSITKERKLKHVAGRTMIYYELSDPYLICVIVICLECLKMEVSKQCVQSRWMNLTHF